MKRKSIYLSIALILLFACTHTEQQNTDNNPENSNQENNNESVYDGSDTGDDYPTSIGSVKIAKWKDNKKAALMMYFYDSTPGQAKIAVPLLNEYKFVGTFFANPGSKKYIENKTIWEHDSQKIGGGCQELANHSMNHHGAKNYAEAESEIADAAKAIWKARGEAENSSFIAFNKGGSTNWEIENEELFEILNKYNNLSSVNVTPFGNYIGESMAGTQILKGDNADKILINKQTALDNRHILMLSFHGISDNPDKPTDDWGNGAVYIDEFKKAMDNLKADEHLFWSAGYVQLHKYIWERKITTPKLTKKSDSEYEITFSRDTSKLKTKQKAESFYNEPITLLVKLADNVNHCTVQQDGKTIPHSIKNGKLKFNAMPFTSLAVKITLKNNNAYQELADDKVDYFVSKSGNDGNAGTKAQPLKTISKAIQKLSNGGIILVEDGDYKEYINIKKSGTKSKPIQIIARNKHKAKLIGFRVLQANSNIKIKGFEIESDMKYDFDKVGIKNYGGENIEISDCYIHDCPRGGIAILQNKQYHNSKNNIIKNNIISHNGSFGILLDGHNSIIEDNVIKETVQNHPKFVSNGIPIPKGADADGIVIFGSHHIIRRNKIVDLASPENQNTDPHSDAIQSSSNATNTVLQDSQIYQNYIRISYKSGKGVILEATKGYPCKNIIIANNIIEFTDIGVNASTSGGNYKNIKVYNNLFKSNLKQKSWGTAIYIKNVNDYAFVNNITIDCKNEHRKIIGGTGTIENNLAYNSDAPAFSMTPPKQASEIVKTDPKFLVYTGKHGENDYHLTKDSPALGTGKILSTNEKAVTENFDGKKRSSWNIGPY